MEASEPTSKYSRWEIIAAVGGLLLAISVFVKCYETQPENENAQINGKGGPNPAEGSGIEPGDATYSIFEVHDIMRFLFLLAAIAPMILLWIIYREHELSWQRGEMTAVVGLTAATLLMYIGIIDRPGEPSGAIELEIGWYGALLGSLMMAVGGAMRSGGSGRPRKPPGIP